MSSYHFSKWQICWQIFFDNYVVLCENDMVLRFSHIQVRELFFREIEHKNDVIFLLSVNLIQLSRLLLIRLWKCFFPAYILSRLSQHGDRLHTIAKHVELWNIMFSAIYIGFMKSIWWVRNTNFQFSTMLNWLLNTNPNVLSSSKNQLYYILQWLLLVAF